MVSINGRYVIPSEEAFTNEKFHTDVGAEDNEDVHKKRQTIGCAKRVLGARLQNCGLSVKRY